MCVGLLFPTKKCFQVMTRTESDIHPKYTKHICLPLNCDCFSLFCPEETKIVLTYTLIKFLEQTLLCTETFCLFCPRKYEKKTPQT